MFQKANLLFLYTETPLHVGSGSSLGTVDLPIQRERHTNLPMVQGSGIKGKLRSVFEPDGNESPTSKAIFGPQKDGSEHAGALSVGDARILLFPVRALAGVFAWVTCPLVISRLARDLQMAGQTELAWNLNSLEVSGQNAYIPNSSTVKIPNGNENDVVLEEFSFRVQTSNSEVQKFADWLSGNVLPSGAEYKFWRDKIKQDLVIISDEAFTDFCQFSTDVVSRTKLDPATKTVVTGALWTEENLPSDALLYAPLFACDPRMESNKPKKKDESGDMDATEVLSLVSAHLQNSHSRLQLGGNETVGRGLVATRTLTVKD
jgi:CRISPR-associated protein Cmr4